MPGRLSVRAASALAGLPAAYLGLLTVASWRAVASGAGRTDLPTEPTHRFVVLIPAHNEEQLIGATLDSLAKLDYPADRFAIHVVADHCTDATAAIVAGRGDEVHEHGPPHAAGKGPALQWLLRRLWERDDPHDAVVIIDADTTLSPNFLRVMDAKLAQGARVVQSYYAVADAGVSPTTALRSAALAARHYLRPLGRTRLGGSAGLYGNGMVFAADVLRDRAWSGHLTEDIAFQVELLLDGTRVAFAPDAVAEAEMPTTLDASQSQHERWERGRLELAGRYAPALARRAVGGGPAGRVAYADAAVDLLIPPFSVLVAGTGLWGALALARSLLMPSRRARRGVLLAGTAALVQVGYVVSALQQVGAPPSTYRALLDAPRLVAWKVRLWTRMLTRGRDVAWVRTARNAERPTESSGP